jgi:tetratricopeptide (TPR) repeat protein
MRLVLAALACAAISALHSPALAAQPLTGSAKLADSARLEIERATTVGDPARLRAVRRMLDQAIAAAPDDPLLLHYHGYAAYRLANLADPSSPAADRIGLLAGAGDLLRRSAALRPLPESYMLLAVVRSRQAAIDSSRRAELEADAQDATQAALLGTGAENPRVLLLSAISALYTPASLGGGPEAAELLLNHAVRLYESDHPTPPLPAWGKAEAYAWLGQVYERTGRRRRALAAYNRALRLEPRFAWVRYGLLPALKKQTS